MAQRPPSAEKYSSEAEDELPALHTDADLPSPDIMIWSTATDAEIHSSPPPRIAQRFYRSSTNRRRSSGASSRKNSITSSHSHHSNRSFRTALHRNSIAQHLRRASILEDRKARLQDRAAHAEQVRLRAAEAKATPRKTNIEEKALAAQQAREKHLAKVAASCAEEVNRSKRIAEENKERKAAEERRYRQELEEKHAEAERRRLEYKRTPRRARTTSQTVADAAKPVVSPTPKRTLSKDEACITIQRTWRRSQRRKLATDFQKLDLSIDRVGQVSFEDATELLNRPDVISCTRGFLRQLGLEAGTKADDKPVKTFLSAFMMLGHPNIIFSRNSEQEQDLISKAKDLLICFESVSSELATSQSATASATDDQNLQQAYATYFSAFDAWKSKDASILIDTMIDQFVALDAIWQTVKDDSRGEVASDYRSGIRDQQIILYSKIKKLAGPERADSLIKRAINQSRRQRSRRRPIGDVRPRQLAESDSGPAETNTPGDASSAVDASREQPAQQDDQPSDLSRIFSVIPTNRRLVHELMIDPTFRVEPSPQADVRNALNREVCESMRCGVAEGEGEIWTVAVAENIRSRLTKLLRPGNSLHNLLTETLDIELIRKQCRHGQFSYDKFFVFMADLLPRLCAPVRDEEVRTLAEVLRAPTENTDSMIEKLFGLLHMIDLLSLDHTNFLIQQQAPMFVREGAGYEQRAFQADLDSNEVTLSRTTRWWRSASINVLTESNVHDPQPIQPRPSFIAIYARGLIDLAFGSKALRDADLPETLCFDFDRLTRIRADLLRFIVVGGVLMKAKSLLKRDSRSQWKPEAKRCIEALQHGYDDPSGDLSARILAIVESGHGMPATSKQHLATSISRYLSEAATGNLRDAVLKILHQRLRGLLYARLAAQSATERVRVAATTSQGLANISLGEFIAQISNCADELCKVMEVDVSGHGVWLRRIALEAEGLGDSVVPSVS